MQPPYQEQQPYAGQPPYAEQPPPYGGGMPAPPPQPVPTPPAPRGGKTGTILGVVAVILAVVALIVSFAIPGATGPKGDTGAPGTDGTNGTNGTTGPQGPPGPGTLMVSNSTSDKVAMGSACTHYTSAEVSITVPRAGTIVVTANVMLDISHTAGTRDVAFVVVHNTTNTCLDDPYLGIATYAAQLPSDTYWPSIAVSRPFPAATAGTYTFYANGRMTAGQDAQDEFWYANFVVVFYPS